MSKKLLIILIISTIFPSLLFSQSRHNNDLTIRDFAKRDISNFKPNQYGGDVQIWSIASDSSGNIYFATGNSFTQWNGSGWDSFHTPKHAYLRALEYNAKDSSIFAAGNYTFGKWIKAKNSSWNYTELYSTNEIIWRIASDYQYTYFNSHESLYSFEHSTGKVQKLVVDRDIDYLHKVGNKIYIQIDGDFYIILSNTLYKQNFRTDDRVVSMVERDSALYLFCEHSGIFVYLPNGRLEPFGSESLNRKLGQERIFSSILSPEGNFIVGTVVDGCYLIDPSGEIIDHISSHQRLEHTTVLSLHSTGEDIWIGLDGSISRIQSNPNQTYYNSLPSHIGYVYCHTIFNNKLYLGTNKGLFCVESSSATPQIVTGTQGQIWDIQTINSHTILNTDRGVYELNDDNSLEFIHSNAWTIKQCNDNSNQFYLTDGTGISLFETTPSGIIHRHKIRGFADANKNIEMSKEGTIWVNGYRGSLVRLELSADKQTVVSKKNYTIPQEKDNQWISMSRIDNDILFYGVNSCYRYDVEQDSIVPSPYYDKIFRCVGSVINSLAQRGDKFFFISDTKVGIVERSGENFKLTELIFLPIAQKMIPIAFRRVSLSGDYVTVDYNNGVAIYDTKERRKDLENFELYKIEYQEYGVIKSLPLDQKLELPSNSTDITLYFTHLDANNVVSITLNNKPIQLSHIDGKVTIPYLDYGNYDMKVMRTSDGATCNISFSVQVPFIESYLFYVVIFTSILLASLLFYFINRYRMQRIKQRISSKQREFLEREQMRFENENLATKVKERDRRLTNFTMTSIRFNNILGDIEKEVSQLKTEDLLLRGKISNIKRSIKMYRRGEENWKLFESYFNNLYDGYLDRLRAEHPNLTSNDIKTAAYIRLSLSTSEIATLMNIAPSSVDTARHRLRKNLGLQSRESLSAYLSRF